ncbi:tail fiber domain-containing protein [Paenibacillus oceani]|uniref:Tail fiber domain-containing protein n=1 Tax=Paenibacillus oceani TaxID=2772510 RepID=A0A927GYF4_9BACL|nr:tail fiber domain-containing protein [Paenibacillus oceani]MBD2861545.1 tail fiber domain-containing protein [Paenibacillus oceani]
MPRQDEDQRQELPPNGGSAPSISRRKLLAAAGLGGAALLSSELLKLEFAEAEAGTVGEAVYGHKGKPWDNGLREELANNADPAKGAAMVGYKGRTVADKLNELASAADWNGDAQLAADAAGGHVYFVPPGADITVDVPSQYPDLNAALHAIERWMIPSSSVVRIRLAAGPYVMPGATRITHPNAEQIHIKGADVTLTAKAVGQTSVTGTAGHYLVTLAVTNAASFAAGDWVMIRKTSGDGNHYAHAGFWEVVSAGANQITVRNRYRQSAFPAHTLASADLYKIGTILKYNDTDGIVVRGSSVGLLEDVGIVGNMYDYWNEANVTGTEKGTHGIYVGSNTIVSGSAAPGGENPLGISGGSISLGEFVCVSQFDQQGICVAGGSGVYGKGAVSTGNGRRGYYVGTSAAIEIKFCIAAGNYLDGVIADYGGCFNTSAAFFIGNRLVGGFAFNGGSLVAPNTISAGNAANGFEARAGAQLSADSATAVYNSLNGIHGEYGGRISCTNATASYNGRDGLSLAFGAVARATKVNASQNTRYGVMCDGGSTAVVTGAATSGNGTADRLAKQLSIIQDGASYTAGTIDGVSRLTLRSGTSTADQAITGGGDVSVSLNGTPRFLYKANGDLHPTSDGVQNLGQPVYRFNDIYAANAVIQTSDERLKYDVEASDLGLDFVNLLTPAKYKMTDGQSGRVHYGLVAQDVERVISRLGMTDNEFAALTRSFPQDNDGGSTGEPVYGLRYTEFIAPLIKAVQELTKRVRELEGR